MTESDLLEKFEQWGAVREGIVVHSLPRACSFLLFLSSDCIVFIPKDFRGRCKGYAFVEFENAKDCAAAIENADRTLYDSPHQQETLTDVIDALDFSVVLSALSLRQERENLRPNSGRNVAADLTGTFPRARLKALENTVLYVPWSPDTFWLEDRFN